MIRKSARKIDMLRHVDSEYKTQRIYTSTIILAPSGDQFNDKFSPCSIRDVGVRDR